jgi:hypothetical protein
LAGYSNVPIEKTDGLVTNYLHARKGHFKVLLTQYWYFIAFKVLITGEGARDIAAGKFTLGKGTLVTNSSGGLKACGHPVGATGVKQIEKWQNSSVEMQENAK